jgi:pimeloyl-ACP methyl ester carboxylesterase
MGLARAGMVGVLAALVTVALAWAQARAQAPPRAKAGAKGGAANNRNPVGVGGAPAQLPKGQGGAIDPLIPDAVAKAGTPGTYHLTLKLTTPDHTSLSATYYPSKLGTNASAVLLIHEKDRSSKDFEEPIEELKAEGKEEGLAEYLQGQNHAVLSLDLRGMGANVRRPVMPKDWQAMVGDLQAAYQFLVDRTNRGELNLSKLCVVGLGEGANLAAAWASQPGGAVSNVNRTSDLCALVLISPMADGEGLLLGNVLASLAPRLPLMVMVGARDPASSDPVRAARPIVERPQYKQNKVEIFDSNLHGYKLLRLEPRVTSIITRFLEGAAKYKPVEWEPRYNLTPVHFEFEAVVRNKSAEAVKAKEAPAPAAKEKEKEAPAKPAEAEEGKPKAEVKDRG